MVTLISHFYNEEYLLPFWIKHHKPLFDNAVLIDHGSTDNSRKIIEHLAPEWKVINSDLEEFDPLLTDFEVQCTERTVDGWKIVLNTSEFLAGDLKGVISECNTSGVKAVIPKARIMIDAYPNNELDLDKPLLTQKPYGVDDGVLYDILFRGHLFTKLIKLIHNLGWKERGRSRLLHSHPIGGYTVGRHNWIHPAKKTNKITICWFGYSPWNNKFISRKRSFANKLPKENLNLGYQHRANQAQLNKAYFKHLLFYKIFGNENLF
jgi:hypothetical protein